MKRNVEIQMAIRNVIEQGRSPELVCNVELSNCGAVQRAMGWVKGRHPKDLAFSVIVGDVAARSLVFGEKTMSFSSRVLTQEGVALEVDKVAEFHIDYDGIEQIHAIASGIRGEQVWVKFKGNDHA